MTDATRILLPCPFCGLTAPNVDTTPLGYAFRCLACNARGPVRPTRAAARAAWDRRPGGAGSTEDGGRRDGID